MTWRSRDIYSGIHKSVGKKTIHINICNRSKVTAV